MQRVVKPTALGCSILLLGCAAHANGEVSSPPVSERAQVVLLGTFHFAPSGLDLRSERRQREIDGVVEQLATWAPTKVAVEWPAESQPALDAAYRTYVAADAAELPVNEIAQLGARLADRLEHDRLHAIDARHRWYSDLPNGIVRRRATALGQRELLQRTRGWNRWYSEVYAHSDARMRDETLAQHLLYLNAAEQLRTDLGRYLVGEIEVGGGGDYTGADVRTAWYNRNLRIYSNILRLRDRDDDRILVVIGAGHVPILRHLVENSPELELVPLASVLEAAPASG